MRRFIISFCQLITKLLKLILSIAIVFSFIIMSFKSLRLSYSPTLIIIIIKLMIYITLLLTLLTLSSQNRVIQITTSNVQLFLKTVDKMHLLLHSPSCPHSKEYASKFLQVKTPYNLGITDCEREKALCNHLNITHFPTLVELTSTAMQIVDEQQFLVREGLIAENDAKVVVNAIVRRLKEEEKHVIVVLEEEGLPVIDRLGSASEKGIFYLEPASRLYKHISSMVGRKIGCWILSTKNNKLQKFYCGNGYKSQQLQKYLQNYQREKLVHHVFTRQVNASFIQQSQLQQIAKEGLEGKRCRLVYFYSKECEHCSMGDVKRVEYVLDEMKVRAKYGLQVFDLDHEEMPKSLEIKRTPELMEFCGSERREFGGIFDIKSLQKFIANPTPKPQPQKPTQL